MEPTTTTISSPLGETGSPSVGWGVQVEHPLAGLVARMRTRLLGELPPVLWSMTDEELTELLGDLHALTAQVECASLARYEKLIGGMWGNGGATRRRRTGLQVRSGSAPRRRSVR